ncbi:MAG: Rieske 2Fe-2S domain-containing protein, partial [Acidobacteria bacterium]|nr:Rieske 2Fe-2S domain-containing protein [Acidobacteriota bacterium]MDW7985296.1 Rieske 2Fe-2S domain-containing protein [Acidobacteriota bacterium]
MSWRRVGRSEDFPEGRGRPVFYGRWRIAVFRVEGRLYVIGHDCPHQGGPLSQGTLDQLCVVCPLHGWTFDLRTGQSVHVPGASVPTFPVEEREDGVY